MFDINLSQLIPSFPANPDVVTFTIKVNNQAISSTYEIKSISINSGVKRIPYAVISLLDGDVANQEFSISDTNIFTPGKEIEITGGYRSEEETLFKGIIICHGIKVKSGKPSLLEIECKDLCVKMTVGRKNKYFVDSTDSEIIEEIIESYSEAGENKPQISGEIESTSVNHEGMVQYYATDWDFINIRAEANGQLVMVEGGLLKTQTPNLEQEPSLVLNLGTSIYEFEAHMDARDQYPAVKASAWDANNQELLEIEANDQGVSPLSGGLISAAASIGGAIASGDIGSVIGELLGEDPNTDFKDVIGLQHFQVQHPGRLSSEELESWALSQYEKSRLSKVKGRVTFEGVSSLKLGESIALKGVGARHEGTFFVTGIKHQIHDGSWFTTAEFGLNQTWLAQDYENVCERPASSLIPAISGLQIGIVTNLESDPEQEDRIQVRLPLIDPTGDGIWARIATLDAGENRGSFFRPELSDEVIVGFLNDDPRDPVVLGMLNSQQKPAPLVASNDNHEKGFVSRSGMKVLFNDDKISLSLETPNGKKILLDEDADKIELEDNFGNKITMGQEGITFDSSKDLIFKAANDIKAEGINIEQKASANYKAQGGAAAEMSASGDAVVKGAFVRIN